MLVSVIEIYFLVVKIFLIRRKEISLLFIKIFFIHFQDVSGDFRSVSNAFGPGAPGVDVFGDTFRLEASFFGEDKSPPEVKAGIVAVNGVADSVIINSGFFADVVKFLALGNFEGYCAVFR